MIWYLAQDIPDGTTFRQVDGPRQWIRERKGTGWYLRNDNGDVRVGWHDNTVTDRRLSWGHQNVDDFGPFAEVKA
ncbi:UNVERIFIED_ORG: hypothetical protein M2328_005724 [Rhodococcus erythropolis]